MSSAARACGIDKRRNGVRKRTRWWNDEVQFAIRRKKILYKEMLTQRKLGRGIVRQNQKLGEL